MIHEIPNDPASVNIDDHPGALAGDDAAHRDDPSSNSPHAHLIAPTGTPGILARRVVGVIALVGAVLGCSNFLIDDVLRPGTPTRVYALLMLVLFAYSVLLLAVPAQLSPRVIAGLVLTALPIYVGVHWTLRDPSNYAPPIMMMFGVILAAMILEWPGFVLQAAMLLAATAYTLADGWTGPLDGLIGQIGVQSGVMLISAGALYLLRRQTERAHAELWRASHTDPLTGLFNRTALTETAPGHCADAARYDRPVMVAVIDLDHFKEINDTRGHSTGDRVLAVVADALVRTAGPRATVARIGGEEFVVVQRVHDPDEAMELASRLTDAVRTIDDPCPVTCSTGVDVSTPGATDGSDWLWRRVSAADEAMYHAKRSGRDRVHVSRDSTRRDAPHTSAAPHTGPRAVAGDT